MEPLKSALVVFSGGQDSTTCLAWALQNFDRVEAISFDYRQTHSVELVQAKMIIDEIKRSRGREIDHLVLSVPFAQSSALNGGGKEIADSGGFNADLPTTFLPGRNAVFLALAVSHAAARGISDVVTGVCQTDYSGYPDCRQVFVEAMATAMRLALDRLDIAIHTPLMRLTKKQTVEMARDLGALDLIALSHTCYRGRRPPCGSCPACVLRAKGFAEAGIPDPSFAPSV